MNAKNKTVTINNSKAFEERWFLETDNSKFDFQSSELDSITESKSNSILIDDQNEDKTNFIQTEMLTLTDDKKDK